MTAVSAAGGTFRGIIPHLLLLAFMLALAGCGAARPVIYPSDIYEPLPQAAPIPHGQGRIWQADFPGQAPSYIFGTIHVNDPRVLELPEAAEAAFAGAQFAAFEADMADELSEAEQRRHFELPEGSDLETLLGEETYEKLQSLALFQFITVKRLEDMQPWIIWTMIGNRSVPIDVQQKEDELVLDDWLQQRARDDGKEVIALETTEEQIRIFSGLSLEDQVSMLRSAIEAYDDPRVKVQWVELYLDGDLAQRYALWQRFLGYLEPGVAQRFNNRLATRRNRAMVEHLLPIFAKGSTFVAVGVMHLPGEQGILRLLEQRGYTVTRLQ
ncbi:MAG: TraB/GumN family protein [Kiloniellaceae bacterium]